MQDGKIKTPIHFGIERLKLNITTDLCQHFVSYTIACVVFDVKLSNIDRGWQEEDTFTFWGQKVKGRGHT